MRGGLVEPEPRWAAGRPEARHVDAATSVPEKHALGSVRSKEAVSSQAREHRWIHDAVRLAGAEGDALLARVRLWICGLLLVTPTYSLASEPQHPAFRWGFAVAVVAMLGACFFYARSGSRPYSTRVGFLSSLWDASLVSSALLLFLLTVSPLEAVNSTVTFEVYFLVIAATSLRCDGRIVVAAGAVAIAQYASIVLYARQNWALKAAEFRGQPQGAYNEVDQITRIILLIAAVIVSSAIVARASRLVQLATSDGLTGVLNRAAFDRLLEREVGRARRYRKALSLAMVDADCFKRINDVYGHASGDRVLRDVGTLLQAAVRESDIVARYGGDEFVVLFPETTAAQALPKLELLRAKVEALFAAAHGANPAMRVTLSVGVSSHPEDGQSAEAILASADGRLLESKRRGRNRVTGPCSRDARA